MYKKIIKMTFVLIILLPIGAHAGFLKNTLNTVIDLYVKAECTVVAGGGIALTNVFGAGIDDIETNVPKMNEAESDVLMDYLYERRIYFCEHPIEGTQHLQNIRDILDRDTNRADALSKFTDYTNDGDNIVDAFRHSRATARISGEMPDDWGLKLMNAHEDTADGIANDGSAKAHKMDLHNNYVGYEAYLHLKKTLNRKPNDTEIEDELLSRCYTYVNRNLIDSSFETEVDSVQGLVYFQKDGIAVEKNGVNCGIPHINRTLGFFNSDISFPNNFPVILSAVPSEIPKSGMVFEYSWSFDRNVKLCGSAFPCYNTNIITSNSPTAFARKTIIPIGFAANPYYFTDTVYEVGDVYLLDDEPIQVTLEIVNQFGEYSAATTAYINNFGPMVPIIGLILF